MLTCLMHHSACKSFRTAMIQSFTIIIIIAMFRYNLLSFWAVTLPHAADYWTFQEMRRFFPFRSFTSNADKPAPAHDKRSESKLDEGGTNGASHSPDTRALRSRRRHGNLRSEESPNPQLRRCLSFTSSAIDRSLDERAMGFSGDIPWFNSSDVPRHVSDIE